MGTSVFFFLFLFKCKVVFGFVLLRFHCSKEEGDGSCRLLLRWLCCKKLVTYAFFCWFSYKEGDNSNVVAFFYSGCDVKKAMAANDYFFYWSLWFSLLKLIINNIVVIFLFRLKVIMARRRRLKKSDGGDLEVHKQNVVSSDQVVAKEIIVSLNQL